MKYLIYSILFLPFALMAGSDKKVFIGVNVTPQVCNHTRILSKVALENQFSISYSAGLTLDYIFNKWLGAGCALTYTDAHSKFWIVYENPLRNSDFNTNIQHLQYLKVPFWLRFNVNVSDKVALYYMPGIYYSGLFNAYEEGIKIRRKFYNNDYGINFTHGITYRFSNKFELDIGAKIDYGLVSIEDNTAGFNGPVITDNRLLIFGISTTLRYKL